MALIRERIVAEDFELGFGTITRTADNGGSLTGNKVGVHTFLGVLYNIKDFGAVGGGIIDDTVAIQAAIDEATVSTVGGMVWIPMGTYKISSTLICTSVSGLTILGAGSGAILQPTAALVGLPVLKCINCRDGEIKDIRINGLTGSAPSSAIEFNVSLPIDVAPTNMLVNRCILGSDSGASLVNGIRWTAGAAADFNNAESTVRDTKIINFSGAAYSIEHSNSLQNRIFGGVVSSSDATSVAVRTAGGSFQMFGTDIHVQDWDFDIGAGTYLHAFSVTGVHSESTSRILRVNAAAANPLWFSMVSYFKTGGTATPEATIDNAAASGIFTATNSIFNFGQPGKIFKFSGASSEASFVSCSLGNQEFDWAYRLRLIANITLTGSMTYTAGGSAKYVEVGYEDGGTDVDFIRGLKGIAPARTATPEIEISAERTRFHHRSETGDGGSVASANDITLSNTGNFFTITGSVTINTISATNWQTGSVIYLYFSAGTTVKHATAGAGAQVFMPGGADYVAGAQATLSLVYNGTVWVQLARW